VFAVIAALALNIATLTFVPAFNLLSSAIGAVAGVMTSKPVTIRSKHQGEIKSHKSQVASLNAEHTKKTNQLLQSHKDKVTSLKAKHSYEFNRLLKSYEVETKKLGSAVKKTIRRISQRVAKATARSIGSIAAESIPYIGIGAIIGVTALELDDACDTMKDLHALDVAFNPEAANDADATEVCGQRVPTKEEVIAELKQSPGKAWEAATNFDLPDFPSWDAALQAARETWWKIDRFMKSTLSL
jgi:hypothetical protein